MDALRLLKSSRQKGKDLTAPFGSIRFPDSRMPPAKFVVLEQVKSAMAVAHQIDNVVSLLLKTWNLSPPCAMIAIPPMGKLRDASLGDSTQLELVIRRGLAEAVAKTSAWVFTSGNGDSPLERVVGRAMLHGRNEFPGKQFTCIGVAPWEQLADRKRISKLKNGMVHKYGGSSVVSDVPDGGMDANGGEEMSLTSVEDIINGGEGVGLTPIEDISSGGYELEPHHSHFLLVDGEPEGAVTFREELEKFISSNDVSGDEIQTPKMLLVINGDSDVLEWVYKAVDADDPSTGTSVPVLVLSDSGGAAKDIYDYIMGVEVPAGGNVWDADNSKRKLPVEDGKGRDAAYVAKAAELLPKILHHGKMTGQNVTRQLAFFTLSKDLEFKDDLANAIQKAMMNDCPDVNEEALLSVVWGEPAFLQEKLEEAAGEILYIREKPGAAKQRKDLLQLGLLLKDTPVVNTILRFTQSPSFVTMNDLFIVPHNRYPVARTEKLWQTEKKKIAKLSAAKSIAAKAGWKKAGHLAALIATGSSPMKIMTNERTSLSGEDKSTGQDEASLTANKDEPQGDGGWQYAEGVLGMMVDGYQAHLAARRRLFTDESDYFTRQIAGTSLDLRVGLLGSWTVNLQQKDGHGKVRFIHRMAPSFGDLMMWAVLAGAHELATLLWTRTDEPIRAAIMASQLCRLLSRDDALRADRDELRERSEEYENLAIEVLDSIRESSDASPLLSLIPWAWEMGSGEKRPQRMLLWDSSVLESSAQDDGLLSVPCMRLVAHRHTQFTLEQYFAGDAAGSSSRVPPRASLVAIMIQALLPILPGTFVEVMPCDKEANRPLKGKKVEEEYKELVKMGFALDRDAKPSLSRSGTPTQGIEWDPDTLDVVKDIDNAMRNFGKAPKPTVAAKRSMWHRLRTLQLGDSETSCLDILADLISLRFAAFYVVPKVKFVVHFMGHFCFIAHFSWFVLSTIATDIAPPITLLEISSWIWSVARFIGEFFELDEFSAKGLRAYVRDVWNMQDIIFIILTVITIALRMTAYSAAAADPTWVPGTPFPVRGVIELAPRSLYSVMAILAYMRVLQYLRYFQSVGVLTIVIGHMLNDVSFFSIILLFVSFGFGFAFSVMLPNQYAATDAARIFGGSPLWGPFWGIFGSFNARTYELFEEADDVVDPGTVVAPTLLCASAGLDPQISGLLVPPLLPALLASLGPCLLTHRGRCCIESLLRRGLPLHHDDHPGQLAHCADVRHICARHQ